MSKRVGLMDSVVNAVSWTLIVVGGLFAFISLLVVFENKPENTSAILGLLMLAAMAGAPGAFLQWRLRRKSAAQSFQLLIEGFIRSRDRLRVDELAHMIGRTPLEAEALLTQLIATDGLNLVFHRATGDYLHRERLQAAARVVDRCPSCGASMASELVLEGDVAHCQYCGKVL